MHIDLYFRFSMGNCNSAENRENIEKIVNDQTKIPENIYDTIFIPRQEDTNIISIIHHLYIGSFYDACCFEALQNLNIKHVINVSEETHGNWFAYKKLGISNYQYSFHYEMNNNDTIKIIDEISKVIKLCIDKGENVFIHCKCGTITGSQNIDRENSVTLNSPDLYPRCDYMYSATVIVYFLSKYCHNKKVKRRKKIKHYSNKLKEHQKNPNTDFLKKIFYLNTN
jgi:hypothetical protein